MRKILIVLLSIVITVMPMSSFAADADDGTVNGMDEVDLGLRKYVEKLDGDDYRLNLTVRGDALITDEVSKLDIIYVIDTTGSMLRSMDAKSDNYSETGERWNAVENCVKRADSYITDNNIDARYSMISFASDNYSTGYSDAKVSLGWTTDAYDVEETMNELGNWLGGGTNYEAPVYTLGTSSLLADARQDAKTVVIFISDGEPNSYYDNDGNNVFDGISGINTAHNEAAARLADIEGIDAFYALGVGDEAGDEVLETFATAANVEDEYKGGYPCASGDELENRVLTILTTHSEVAISDITVYDTLSEWVHPVKDSDITLNVMNEDGNSVVEKSGSINEGLETAMDDTIIMVHYNSDTKQIEMDFPDDYALDPSYTFRISLIIEPTTEAYQYFKEKESYPDTGEADTGVTSAGVSGFDSNAEGSAYVSYRIGQNSDKQTRPYPMPVVQVTNREDQPKEDPPSTTEPTTEPENPLPTTEPEKTTPVTTEPQETTPPTETKNTETPTISKKTVPPVTVPKTIKKPVTISGGTKESVSKIATVKTGDISNIHTVLLLMIYCVVIIALVLRKRLCNFVQ